MPLDAYSTVEIAFKTILTFLSDPGRPGQWPAWVQSKGPDVSPAYIAMTLSDEDANLVPTAALHLLVKLASNRCNLLAQLQLWTR